MMLERKELEKLVGKYEALHVKNFDLYQQCGEQKYLRASERYEDMAQAFQMAANAEEDYSKKVHYGTLITYFAQRAAEALRDGDQAKMENVLKYIIDEADRNKLYWKRGEF